VTDEATDNRSLLPMAEAAKEAVGDPPTLQVVADAGYSNGEQAEACEARGIVPHVPANRAVNNQGTDNYSTVVSSNTTKRRIRSAARPSRFSKRKQRRAKIEPCTMPRNRNLAAPVF